MGLNDYFILDINLPIDEIPELDGWVSRFEREILTKALGFSLYYEYITSLSDVSPAQKWIDLRDGKVYTKDGINYQWRGMTNSNKESFISYYVFYKYISHGINSNSLGVKMVNSENSTFTDKRYIQTYVYNKMIDFIAEMNEFILYSNSVDSSTYPNYYPECIRKVNLFNI